MSTFLDMDAAPLKSEMAEERLAERTISGLHEALLRRLPEISFDDPVLDLGCGTGAWLDRLASIGFKNLHGVDQDIEQFKATRALISQADLNRDDLGLAGKKFGLISAIELIEHLENPGRLFHHASQHLKEDGWLLLTTPNIHSIPCRLKFLLTGRLASFDGKGDPTHIYPVLLTSLERLLPRYSLKIVEMWGYPANGSLVFRRSVRLASAVLGMALPSQARGDNLCLLIKRSTPAKTSSGTRDE